MYSMPTLSIHVHPSYHLCPPLSIHTHPFLSMPALSIYVPGPLFNLFSQIITFFLYKLHSNVTSSQKPSLDLSAISDARSLPSPQQALKVVYSEHIFSGHTKLYLES